MNQTLLSVIVQGYNVTSGLISIIPNTGLRYVLLTCISIAGPSGVPKGVLGGSTPPPHPKFRS
jgi:hypothetical protein